MKRANRVKPAFIALSAAIYAFTVLEGTLNVNTAEKGLILAPKEAVQQELESVRVVSKRVDREKVLKSFFSKLNSPLEPHSKKFVEIADTYGLDYRLLPAISCMESTCGKRMIPESYNPFGWGIYGNTYVSFVSFDEAIETVGRELTENYIMRGLDTPSKIAPVYTPPNHTNWLNGVNYFIGVIQSLEEQI